MKRFPNILKKKFKKKKNYHEMENVLTDEKIFIYISSYLWSMIKRRRKIKRKSNHHKVTNVLPDQQQTIVTRRLNIVKEK